MIRSQYLFEFFRIKEDEHMNEVIISYFPCISKYWMRGIIPIVIDSQVPLEVVKGKLYDCFLLGMRNLLLNHPSAIFWHVGCVYFTDVREGDSKVEEGGS